jgi:hypothetical protein
MDANLLGNIADLPVEHVDGSLVSARISRVVEAIRDYDPNIEVQWIPRDARREGDAAFRLIHNAPGKRPYVMFFVQTEEEFDDRVLKRIYANDQAQGGGTTMSEYEAALKAKQELERRRKADSIAEANDIAWHVFKSKLNTYKVNKDLVIKE